MLVPSKGPSPGQQGDALAACVMSFRSMCQTLLGWTRDDPVNSKL